MTTNTTVANMEYTTEQIVDLYYQYKPKEVQVNGEVYYVNGLGDYGSSYIRLSENKDVDYEQHFKITDCRLILRPFATLKSSEILRELAGTDVKDVDLFIGSGTIRLWRAYNHDNYRYYKTEFDLHENTPYFLAKILFKMQINFLNLPSTICVEQ